MKRSWILCVIKATCGVIVLCAAGCMSIPNTPAPRFYMLSPLASTQSAPTFALPQDMIIEVGPVKIPDYQNRPQIVTQDANKMLTVAQFDRWGQSLNAGLASVIVQDLTHMLPAASVGAYPLNYAIPVNYRVTIDVVQLESRLDRDLSFVAQWSLIDPKNNTMLITRRSEFHQVIAPHDYSGLADALSQVCVSLSGQIAEALSAQAKTPDTKGAM